MVNGSGVAVMMVLVLILLFSISKSALCKVSVEQMCIHMELKRLIQICCVADKVSFDIVGGGFFGVQFDFSSALRTHTQFIFTFVPHQTEIQSAKQKCFSLFRKGRKLNYNSAANKQQKMKR